MTINGSSVVLVSGGARGITARCVVRMAQAYRCAFILLGRSSIAAPEPAWAQGVTDEAALKQGALSDLSRRGEKPTPVAVRKAVDGVYARREIEATLREVAAAGGRAEYVSVDVTDRAALAAAVAAAEARLGRVTALVHGAGSLADKKIENKTERDFESVYSAKVDGLANLLAAVDPARLSALILFSSVAGFYGNVGQTDYALANEVLNKFAHQFQHRYPHCRVVSINWGAWDAGMVTPELKAYFAQYGVKTIPLDVGTDMLIDELEARHDHSAQVVIGTGITTLRREPDDQLRTHRLHRRLTLEDNAFLADHVVNSKAVLPMVSAMAWMANAVEAVYPGWRSFSFSQYKVLKGIVFDETLAADYTLELRETHKSADAIVFDARISSQTADGKPRFHYSAQLTALPALPPMPIYPNMDLTVREDLDGEQLYQDGTLFHGFSFKGVERVLNISRDKVTMQCRLPVVSPAAQGQFPVHSFNYFMVDIGFQSMGIFARHFYGAGSLPLQAGGGEHYADVPWGGEFYISLEIRTASDTGLVTDLFIHDRDGRIYMIVTGGEVTLSTRLNDMFLLNKLPEKVKFT